MGGIIDQMLRDLDKRHTHPTGAAPGIEIEGLRIIGGQRPRVMYIKKSMTRVPFHAAWEPLVSAPLDPRDPLDPGLLFHAQSVRKRRSSEVFSAIGPRLSVFVGGALVGILAALGVLSQRPVTQPLAVPTAVHATHASTPLQAPVTTMHAELDATTPLRALETVITPVSTPQASRATGETRNPTAPHAGNTDQILVLRVRTLAASGRYPEALALLQSELPPLQKSPETHALLASLHQKAGDPDAAMEIYWKLIDAYPEAGTWWIGVGRALEGKGHLSEALEMYKRALQDPMLDAPLRRFVGQRMEDLQLTQREQLPDFLQ